MLKLDEWRNINEAAEAEAQVGKAFDDFDKYLDAVFSHLEDGLHKSFGKGAAPFPERMRNKIVDSLSSIIDQINGLTPKGATGVGSGRGSTPPVPVDVNKEGCNELGRLIEEAIEMCELKEARVSVTPPKHILKKTAGGGITAGLKDLLAWYKQIIMQKANELERAVTSARVGQIQRSLEDLPTGGGGAKQDDLGLLAHNLEMVKAKFEDMGYEVEIEPTAAGLYNIQLTDEEGKVHSFNDKDLKTTEDMAGVISSELHGPGREYAKTKTADYTGRSGKKQPKSPFDVAAGRVSGLGVSEIGARKGYDMIKFKVIHKDHPGEDKSEVLKKIMDKEPGYGDPQIQQDIINVVGTGATRGLLKGLGGGENLAKKARVTRFEDQ